eukprot:1329095-Amorphochlora_amoeboformis.AAC.1
MHGVLPLLSRRMMCGETGVGQKAVTQCDIYQFFFIFRLFCDRPIIFRIKWVGSTFTYAAAEPAPWTPRGIRSRIQLESDAKSVPSSDSDAGNDVPENADAEYGLHRYTVNDIRIASSRYLFLRDREE